MDAIQKMVQVREFLMKNPTYAYIKFDIIDLAGESGNYVRILYRRDTTACLHSVFGTLKNPRGVQTTPDNYAYRFIDTFSEAERLLPDAERLNGFSTEALYYNAADALDKFVSIGDFSEAFECIVRWDYDERTY